MSLSIGVGVFDTTAPAVEAASAKTIKIKIGYHKYMKIRVSIYGNYSSKQRKAKEWIANRESGGSYTARNGRYYGRYQLSKSYLHGNYSYKNQEKVANKYVKNRYRTWTSAKKHWQRYGWY